MLKEKQALLKDKLKNILADVGHLAGLKHEVGKEFLVGICQYINNQVFMGNESMTQLVILNLILGFIFIFNIAFKAIKEKQT